MSLPIHAAAFLVVFLGVAYMRRWAARHSILDVPNERSSHETPTPRGGGLPMAVVTIVGFGIVSIFKRSWTLPELLTYEVSAIVIATVSWIDDLRSLPNSIRFSVHSLAAVAIVIAFGGFTAVHIPVVGTTTLGVAGVVLSAIWIVGLTNAYNFMDGIDGIAGSQALVAAALWILFGIVRNDASTVLLGGLLAAASAAFLFHNWPPARIFMGDVGSAFLGFTFAALALGASGASAERTLLGVAVVWPFVFDSVLTFTRRLIRRERVFSAHRSHLYQRLVIAGASHATVTSIYLTLAVVGGVFGLAATAGRISKDFAMIAISILAAALWASVLRYELRARSRSGSSSSGAAPQS